MRGPDEEAPGVEGCGVEGLDAAAVREEVEALSRAAAAGELQDVEEGGGFGVDSTIGSEDDGVERGSFSNVWVDGFSGVLEHGAVDVYACVVGESEKAEWNGLIAARTPLSAITPIQA